MKEYTFGKKVFATVLHQMFIILMVTGVFLLSELASLGSIGSLMPLSVLSMIGMVGSLITLAYLSQMTGQTGERDPEIHFRRIDRMDSELLFLALAVFFLWTSHLLGKLRRQEFALASLLVAAGAVAFVLDLVFLGIYLSIIRRMKGDCLLSGCRVYKLAVGIRELSRQRGGGYPPTRRARERAMLIEATEAIAAGALDTHISEEDFHGDARVMAKALNHLRDGMRDAVHESIQSERMKAELITNVSHDIKTPLTSIINYAELLQREDLQNEKAEGYIRIIVDKSKRLKQLTEDLVEVSRISSGNVKLEVQEIDFVELVYQTGGEYNERFEARGLEIVTKLAHNPVVIRADGRQLYRAVSNLYTNAAKYALENSRVHVELGVDGGRAVFSIKNITKTPIRLANGDYEELTERFVRGEASRTTEGSGLGLSIVKNLVQLMGGELRITVEDDLFCAILTFPVAG